MNQTQRTPPINPHWYVSNKRLLLICLGFLLLITAIVFASLYYIRSGRLNRYIANQVVEALKEYGLRTEIGKFEIAWGISTAKVRDIKVYNQQTGQLIATVDRLELVAEILEPHALRLRREIIFKRLDLNNLNIWLDMDEQGRSNLRGLHPAPPNPTSRITFDFSSLIGALKGGILHVNDRAHKIEGELGNLQAIAQPLPGGTMVKAQITTVGGRIRYQGRETNVDGIEFVGSGGETGAEIERFILRSPIAQASTSGRIDDWKILRYNFSFQTRVALDEVTRVLEPGAVLQGTAGFDGRVEGEGARYRITGDLNSNEFTAAGARARGAKIAGISVESDGEKISFAGKQARIQTIAVKETNLTNVAVGAIQGKMSDGRMLGNVPQVSVDRIEFAQGQISGVTLQKVTASVDKNRYQVRGNLEVKRGASGDTSFGPLNGELIADNGTVALNKFNASLFGGSASGDVEVHMGSSGNSRLKAGFTRVMTVDIFTLVSANHPAPLAGTVEGNADLSWPGTDLPAASGTLTAKLSGDTTQTPEAIPVRGDVEITARSGLFDVTQFTLSAGATRLTATGRVSREGDSDLRFSLNSTKVEELQTIAYSVDEVKKSLKDYEPQMARGLKFEGRITGPLKDPTLEGDLNADSISLHNELLGSLTGHLRFSPVEAGFENGLLTAANNGTLKFSYVAAREKLATEGRLDAALDHISVDTLIAAAGLTSEQKLISGDLSGEAHLTALPNSPNGKVTVNLVNGMIAGQSAELATANLVLDGQTAQLDRAEVRLPQGHLIANGTLDLKSNNFELKGKADSVDLSGLVNSLDVKNPSITGTADTNIQASGNTKDLNEMKVELTAQGKDVMINGRAAGQLTLTARTSQNGRIDVDLITGIAGKPQPLRASIELRGPGRPVEVETNLTNFDLSPVIAAFAPDLASSIAGAVSGKLSLTGPTVNERGEATFDGLHGTLSLTAISLQLMERKINVQTPFTISLNGPQVKLEPTRVYGEGIDLNLGGVIGFNEGGRMSFAANGTANLDTLSGLNTDYFFSGTLSINARIEGSVNEPQLGGDIRIDGFNFFNFDPQIYLEEGNGRILLSGDKVTLESFTARVNDGNVKANGTLTLAQFQPKDWRFGLNASNILFFYQGTKVTLESDLTLSGTPEGQLLGGKVIIPQAEYVTDFNFDSLTSSGKGGFDLGGGGGTGGKSFALAPLSLNLHVQANESLLVRNEQINTVGTALLTIGGTLNEPSITGRVTFEGGTIKFRSQSYDITTGILDFPIGAGVIPDVNILTEGDVSGHHIYVGLTGPLNDMDVTLRSEPDLPQSEVLSLVTTGRTDSDTLGSEELTRSGVKTAASFLIQQFISKPTQSLLGLSRFQIDPVLRPNDNPAARMTIGQQLARNLGFTYSTNLASEQDQTALVEYTLTNRFSGVAAYTQGGSSTQGGSKDSDFTIEMRGRKRFSLGYLARDLFGTTRTTRTTPVRLERAPLPHADVSIEKPEGVSLNDKKLRELLPVAKDGYSSSLARLGERNLANYLQEHGYFFAAVSSRCEPANCSGPDLRVLYDVQPGQRLGLEEIRLVGTKHISLSDVSGELKSQTASIFGGIPIIKNLPLIGGYARGITSNDRLIHDREVIRSRLVDLGFRSARVESRLATKTKSEDLVVIFDVEEGSRSIISEVTITGNTSITSSELRELVPIRKKEFFSLTKVREGTQNIKKFYADRGYLDAGAELNVVDLSDDQVRLVYNVTEGNRNVASEVLITGQTNTHEDSIRRFLLFQPGDVLTPELIRRTQRDLYATGAFSEVNIRTEPVGSEEENARRVTVGVTEAKPLLFVYGTGYSTDDGPRGLIQLTHTNLFGRVNTGSIRLRASRREQLAQLSYTDLRPFNTKWATTISAYYDRNTDLQSIVRKQIVDGKIQNEPTLRYGINRFVAFIQTERKLSEITSARLRYSYEDARLSNIKNIPSDEIGRNDRPVRLGLFSLGFTRDTRDSALNPTRGQLFSAEHSIAASIFGGNESYNKFFSNYQFYRTLPQTTPLLRDSVFAATARIGLAAPFKVILTGTFDDNLLPISERFFAGGATTLRGFRYEEAGPQAFLEPRTPGELPALVPKGGNALTIFNFELRYPLTRRLRIIPFYDLGNVFPLVSDISFSGMTNSVGLGLRINTPIGPVGVDYGYLLDPPSYTSASGAVLRPPRGVLHIRFGQSF